MLHLYFRGDLQVFQRIEWLWGILSRSVTPEFTPAQPRLERLELNSHWTEFEFDEFGHARLTLSEMLSTMLTDLPGNTNKVHTQVYRFYTMACDFFRVVGVKFEVWSQSSLPGTQVAHNRLSSCD